MGAGWLAAQLVHIHPIFNVILAIGAAAMLGGVLI